jgi:hypothetical protein
MYKRTRFKLAVISLGLTFALALAKNWCPGISVELVIAGLVNIGVYIWGETKRPGGTSVVTDGH